MRIKFILTMMLCLVEATAMAYSFKVDGFYYYINDDVPNTVAVGMSNGDLEEYFPDGAVIVPESVTYEGTSYTVTAIGNEENGAPGFYSCSSLKSVIIPNSVTTIGRNAFGSCTNLASINIPNSVTVIESYAFTGCSNLVYVNISNSVATIKYGTFESCTSLTSINIPNSVTTIEYYAFCWCFGLTSVTIGNSVTNIDLRAFIYCSSLESINIVPDNPHLKSIDGVVFNHAADTLLLCPPGRQGEYSIPNSVTSIGDCAFWGCRSLSSVNIPNPVTTIGKYSFAECDTLSSVSIPNSVTTIGESAFSNCTNLTSVNIPNSVTTIGAGAFGYCRSLTSLIIPNSVTSLGNGAFRNCVRLASVHIPNSIDIIGDSTFLRCDSLVSVNIPNSVTSIGCRAFFRCFSLSSLIIPNSVTSIGAGAFSWCSSLSSLIIPNSVTSIGDYAFGYCQSLTSLIIPNSVTSIGSYAFYYCNSLKSITIPNSVTEIGRNAFSECTSLKYVTVLRTIPPTLGSNCFSNIGESNRLTVKCGCQSAYMNSDWNQWFSTIEQSCDSHSITVIEATQPGGTVGTSLNEANLGDEVEINITTTAGYEIKNILVFNVIDDTQTVPTYKKSETATAKTFAFTMPAYNVKVYVDIRPSGQAIEEQNSMAVNIFPNPTNGSVTIEAENMQRICVYNIMGQKVLEKLVSGNRAECNMGSYSKGVYLIQIETSKGVVTKQIVVE